MKREAIVNEARRRIALAFPGVKEAKASVDYRTEQRPNFLVMPDDEILKATHEDRNRGKKYYENELPLDTAYAFDVARDMSMADLNAAIDAAIASIRQKMEPENDFQFYQYTEELDGEGEPTGEWIRGAKLCKKFGATGISQALVFPTTVLVVVTWRFEYTEEV